MEFDIVDQRVSPKERKYSLYELGQVISHHGDIVMVCRSDNMYFLLDLHGACAITPYFESTNKLADLVYADTDAEIEELNLNGVINN